MQDSLLTAFTGELLALAGPLDFSAIALKPSCLPETGSALSAPIHTADRANPGKFSDATTLTTMMAAALQLMADYLVDTDVLVIKSAQFTLRHLMSTQQGQDAFSLLRPETQGYLQVMQHLCNEHDHWQPWTTSCFAYTCTLSGNQPPLPWLFGLLCHSSAIVYQCSL